MKTYTHDEIRNTASDIACSGKVGEESAVKVMTMLEQGADAVRRMNAAGIQDDAASAPGRMKGRIRADLVYCMDYIMHHLNDEHAIAHWLQDGCPDGICQASKNPPSDEYETLDVTDEEFEEYLSVFTRTLARQVMPDLPPLSGYKSVKGALA